MNNVDKKSDEKINQKQIETLIFIASDHAGYDLKEQVIEFLESQNNKNLFNNNDSDNITTKYIIKNLGCDSADSVDYPDYAIKVANSVRENMDSTIRNINSVKGILICGTGSGMAITANKIKRIRAVNCFTTEMAEMAVKHNNANILCLGARILDVKTANNIIRAFLNADFEWGRHQNRINKISAIEV